MITYEQQRMFNGRSPQQPPQQQRRFAAVAQQPQRELLRVNHSQQSPTAGIIAQPSSSPNHLSIDSEEFLKRHGLQSPPLAVASRAANHQQQPQ